MPMRLKTLGFIAPALTILFVAILACNIGVARPSSQPSATPMPLTPAAPVTLTPEVVGEVSTEAGPTPTPPVAHQMKPADLAVVGKLVYDVESEGTAGEKRAPYG